MPKFRTHKEMDRYLDTLDFSSKKVTPMSSVYFLVRHNGREEMVYFTHFEDTWFESPCCLHQCQLTEQELREYVEETYIKEAWDDAFAYEKTLLVDGVHYEIDNPQCAPWLDKDIEIVKMVSEVECLQWLINNKNMR